MYKLLITIGVINMGNIADAFNKVGIKPTDFPEVEIDTQKIECDMQIEFLDKWLNLLKRNAPEKEKHNFVTKHGFLSVKHLELFLVCSNEVGELRKELKEKEIMANNIKDIRYYKMIMLSLKKKDISPYGVDLIRNKNYF